MSACAVREGYKALSDSMSANAVAMAGASVVLRGASFAVPILPVKAALGAASLVATGLGAVNLWGANHFRSRYDQLEAQCFQERVQPPTASGGGGGSRDPGSSLYVGPRASFVWNPGWYSDDGYTITVMGGSWTVQYVPILIDIDFSNQFVTAYNDINGDGRTERYAWTYTDGILVYDYNNDGIGQTEEWSLTSFVPGATTDLEALAAFDTNGDNIFDSRDAEFSKFRVGYDHNQNGFLDQGELAPTGMYFVAITLVPNANSNGAVIAPGVRLYEQGGTWGMWGNYDFDSVGFGIKTESTATYQDGVATIINEGPSNFLVWTAGAVYADLNTFSYAGYGSIRDFVGGDGNDAIYGTNGSNILMGGAGADVIVGYDGNDIIIADAADLAYGYVRGGAGQDILVLETSSASWVMTSGLEFEAISGAAGNDFISAQGSEAAQLFGGEGNDHLIGSAAGDVLAGGSGVDFLDGGSGDDLYQIDFWGTPSDKSSFVTTIEDGSGLDAVLLSGRLQSDVVGLSRFGSVLQLTLSDQSQVRLNGAFDGLGVDTVYFDDGSSRTVSSFTNQYWSSGGAALPFWGDSGGWGEQRLVAYTDVGPDTFFG